MFDTVTGDVAAAKPPQINIRIQKTKTKCHHCSSFDLFKFYSFFSGVLPVFIKPYPNGEIRSDFITKYDIRGHYGKMIEFYYYMLRPIVKSARKFITVTAFIAGDTVLQTYSGCLSRNMSY
jgi:hypothetical protein